MFTKMISAAFVLAMTTGYAAAESHAAAEMDADATMEADAEMEFELTGDAEKGEKVFRKCMACHAVGEDAKNKVGPILNGVVGAKIAAHEDFDYSDALKEKGEEGMIWDPENLAAFLEKPRDFAKGTKMSFAGLRKEDDRADVIAYLATFK